MPMCWACDQINPTYIGARAYRPPNIPEHQPPKIRTCMLDSAAGLPLRARECPFCALLHEGYGRELARAEALEHKSPEDASAAFASYDSRLRKERIEICFEAKAPHPLMAIYKEEPVRYRTNLWIHSIVAFVPANDVANNIVEVRLRCFAKEGSAAALSEDILGCPPVPTTNGHEAHRPSINGTPLKRLYEYGEGAPRLPTRVIEVGSSKGNVNPRLVESQGRSSQFWALSHCWGPPDKRPPMTTKSNLPDRLASIPFGSLPKTFQDAIAFTRDQGVKYLWIDSLCIIQDDTSDWERESMNMATVYEQAEVVIVAADAENPQQGLFYDREPHSQPVAMKYYYLNEDLNVRSNGSYFVWYDPVPLRPRYHWFKGPLSERGWAFQEWILSQRRIFFTRFGIIWECSDVAFDETGDYHGTKSTSKTLIDRGTNWDAILPQYTRLKFTYLTDRLFGLEGLRSRFPDKQRDDYHFGLWQSGLPRGLLWRTEEKADRKLNPIKAPSWSWASGICSIVDLEQVGLAFDSLIEDLKIQSSWRIEMTAMISLTPRILRFRRAADAHPDHDDPRSTTLAQLRNAPRRLPEEVDFVICSENCELIGLAHLDEQDLDALPENVYFIALMGFVKGSEAREEDPNSAFRGLLVQRSRDGEFNVFTRVGAGLVYAKWMEDRVEPTRLSLE